MFKSKRARRNSVRLGSLCITNIQLSMMVWRGTWTSWTSVSKSTSSLNRYSSHNLILRSTARGHSSRSTCTRTCWSGRVSWLRVSTLSTTKSLLASHRPLTLLLMRSTEVWLRLWFSDERTCWTWHRLYPSQAAANLLQDVHRRARREPIREPLGSEAILEGGGAASKSWRLQAARVPSRQDHRWQLPFNTQTHRPVLSEVKRIIGNRLGSWRVLSLQQLPSIGSAQWRTQQWWALEKMGLRSQPSIIHNQETFDEYSVGSSDRSSNPNSETTARLHPT